MLVKLYPKFGQLDTKPVDGVRHEVNNMKSSQIFWYNHPNGTSMKALRHWRQIIKAKRFQLYDFGDKNLEKYGSEIPPLIDISKINFNANSTDSTFK